MTTRHHLFSIRLPAVQRWGTYVTLAMVAVSGIAWTLFHDVLALGWMLTERRLLMVHGVAAAFVLIVVGGLLPLHIRLAWRVRRNLVTGLVTLGAMALLGATGLLLYYGSEEWRDAVRWGHIGVGVLATVAVPLHIVFGRRQAARVSTHTRTNVVDSVGAASNPHDARRAG